MQKDPRPDIIARYNKLERPLLDELAGVGIRIQSVWDLDEFDLEYPAAIPVLLTHMDKDYSALSRSGIISAVCKKWARDQVWQTIIKAYETEPNLARYVQPGEIGSPSSPKSAMANGILEMAVASDMDKLIELIENPMNGPSRILLTPYFSRSRQQRAFDTLARLSDDPDLKVEIAHILKRKLRYAASKRGAADIRH